MQGRARRGGVAAIAALSAVALLVPLTSGSAGADQPTSPGITSTTITVGQIDDLTAPYPGLFKAAQDGTQAYFDYVNSQGGVDGRKIELDAMDSAFNSGQVVTETTNIADKDFAMVGGYSLLDGAEKPGIDAGKLPDVTYPLATNLASDPNVYSPSPSTTNDTPNANYTWAKNTFPQDVKSVGALYTDADPTTITSEQILESAMTATGLHITYRRGFSTSETTFPDDVLKMKSQGVKMYFNQELAGYPYAANLAKETAQQDYHPVHIEGVAAYVQNMASASGGAANGMYLEQQAALFEGEDATKVPEVALMDKWAKKVDPGVFSTVTPLPALDGWASGMLFVNALKAAGSNPTRASVMAQLDKVTSFDARGLLPPGENPAKNIPSKCFLFAQMKNDKWTRINPTTSGWYCNGTLKPHAGLKPETR